MSIILNTTEIESALVNFQASYPDLCQRIELPERTYEARTCHALRIARNYNPDKLAVLIIGGVHAREWGGPDIVVNFAGDLLRAYSKGKGLKYLKKTFAADEIRMIVIDAHLVNDRRIGSGILPGSDQVFSILPTARIRAIGR